LWRWSITLPVTWALHTLAMWVWHAPPLFQGALASDTLHAAEHACFLGTGVLYWWALLRHGARAPHGYALAVLSVFAMGMQSSALGALLTFSAVPWYPAYAAGEARWGFTPLNDQQLAGLIMWVPAGLVYTTVALTLFALWLQREEARVAGAAGAASVAGAQPQAQPR
jgi:putative membrane protein